MPDATKKTASRSTRAKAKSTVKVAEDIAGVDTSTPAASVAEVDENIAKKNVNAKKKIELNNDDEVEVVALIPNVSYYDKATGDRYEWDNAGDVEYMTVEALQRSLLYSGHTKSNLLSKDEFQN